MGCMVWKGPQWADFAVCPNPRCDRATLQRNEARLMERGAPTRRYARRAPAEAVPRPETAGSCSPVALLSLAHDRSCEAQLAAVLADDLDNRRMPDIHALLTRFAPDPARLPEVSVHLASLSSYDVLVESSAEVAA